MKRLVVLLAFSAMGSGCVVSDTCDARTVSIGWSSFTRANNDVPQCATSTDCTAACNTAGVSDIDVLMDDTPVATVSCAAGGLNVTGVLNDGDHVFTVEGIASNGAIALRDEVTVSNSNCHDQVVDTQPSQGTFVLDYSFSDNPATNICQSDTNSFIWFTLHDDISGDTIAYDSTNLPKQWDCSASLGDLTPAPISLVLPQGPFTLKRTEEVLYPGPTEEAGNCNATQFQMSPGTQSTLDVRLGDLVSCFP